MSEAVRDPDVFPLQQVLQRAETSCIKCGFCLPVCPTYRLTGREAASPRGRIDLMQSVAYGELEASDIFEQLDFCLGCRACETACPAGVKFGDLLQAGRVAARAGALRSRVGERMRQFGFQRLLTSPGLLGWIAGALHLYQVSGLQALLRRGDVLRRIAPVLPSLAAMLPDVPSRMKRRPLPTEMSPQGVQRGQVALLTGCVMPELLPEVNRATAEVLVANGYRVFAPPAQRCCGALHAHAGELEVAQRLAKQNIAAFEAVGAEWVVVNAAGCGAMMKEYGHLLADDAEIRTRAEAFSRRVRDVSEVLAMAPLRGVLQPLPMRVAYDDPCHLLHGQHIREQPRALLRQVPALELVEVPEGDWCCGSAGLYSLVHPETANALTARKIEHIASVRPQLVATGNPGCILQLRRGMKQCDLDIEVCHPVEVLARAYAPAAPAGCGVGALDDDCIHKIGRARV